MARPGGCGHSHWHQPAVALRPHSLILRRCLWRRGHVSAMQRRKVQSVRACSGGIQLVGGTSSFGFPCSTSETMSVEAHTDFQRALRSSPTSAWRIMSGQAAQKRQGQVRAHVHVCLCVRVRMHACSCASACVRTWPGPRVSECMRVCARTFACVWCMHVRILAQMRMRVCVYAFMSEYTCICMCACTGMCMYMEMRL